MSTEIVLYTHPLSRGRVARWMLEETGLPYQAVILDYGTTMKAPDYLAINPMGKVPALRHGEAVVTENAAICAYLADLVPERHLAPPPGSPARADYYRWLFFLAGPVEALLTAKESGVLAPARSAGYGHEADLLQTLEQGHRGPRIPGRRVLQRGRPVHGGGGGFLHAYRHAGAAACVYCLRATACRPTCGTACQRCRRCVDCGASEPGHAAHRGHDEHLWKV